MLGSQKDHWIIQVWNHPHNGKEEILQTKYSPGKIKNYSDKNDIGQEDGDYEPVYTESVDIQEISKGKLERYIDKSHAAQDKIHKSIDSDDADKRAQGKPIDAMSNARKLKKSSQRSRGSDLAMKKLYGKAKVPARESTWFKIQSVLFENTIKAGKMKLNDGSTVTVTMDDAKFVNQMMNNLDKVKKAELNNEIMKDKGSFQSVVSFARETLKESTEFGEDIQKEVQKSIEYLQTEIQKLFSKDTHQVKVGLGPMKGSIAINFANVPDNNTSQVNFENAKMKYKLMMHFTNNGGKVVPLSKYSMEILTKGSREAPKFRKTSDTSILGVAKKTVAWFKKNKDALSGGINEEVDLEESRDKLPPHLQKHFNKDGSPIKGTWKNGKWYPDKKQPTKSGQPKFTIKDRTPKGYGPDDVNESLDNVDPKAVKKKFKNREDQDIDNDGDVDGSDEYLHKRRKAISKNMKEGAATFTAASKRAEKKHDAAIQRAKRWMKRTGLSAEAAMKEFELFPKDIEKLKESNIDEATKYGTNTDGVPEKIYARAVEATQAKIKKMGKTPGEFRGNEVEIMLDAEIQKLGYEPLSDGTYRKARG